MNRWHTTIAVLALGVGAPVAAQVPTTPQPFKAESELFRKWVTPGDRTDPLADAFFPPELVMKNQQAIGLTGEQRAAIVQAVQATQPRFIEAQWQLEAETAALAELVKGEHVDEARVLQQIDRVLDLERQIKRSQIELLVRIKNQLTPEQQQQLGRLGRGAKYFGLFEPGPDAHLFTGEYLTVRPAGGGQ